MNGTATPSMEEIETFVTVVERGSISAAADQLGVAKSSVSRRLTHLEDKLGVRLIQRSTRTLALTEAGTHYHGRVIEALGELTDAATMVRELHQTPNGEVRLTAPSDSAQWVASMLAAFHRAYPQVRVTTYLTQRRVDIVGEGFDLAIRAGSLTDSSLIAKRIASGAAYIVASPDYLAQAGTPMTLDDARTHPWIVFGRDAMTFTLRREHDEVELTVQGPFATNDFALICELARAGVGLAMVPQIIVARPLARGEVVRVLPEWTTPEGELNLVYPSRRMLPAKVRVLRDFIADWAPTFTQTR